ncbi:hypothetical protein [Actinoplanes sp. NBRC 103695]|uniref:hypothetical protein n=1 Tax=Actinoplanes sp. NBRC 103695 TaxID=3032202 RepID=UPI0024A44E84|nr:hypothetical protein [Actinoplanes sp. NBRC 103695]GLY96582.1 hypothetical protein Acsp02_38370 [Actinoplanes sp. NBRC 103695]
MDLSAAVAALAATAARSGRDVPGDTAVSPAELLDALVLLRRTQSELADLEPVLIAAARAAGVSWQALAPALGVASRQAAERRYLRGVSAPTGQPPATRDERVQAERDRRAGNRAVTRWANDNTSDLRRLAGQVTALTDLDEAAGEALTRLHDALGDPDASALPALLAAAQQHLHQHPGLAGQIDTVTARTDQIRQRRPHQPGNTTGGRDAAAK